MPLTIATWNVQNFALPSGGTSVAFGQKLKLIAATLAAVDADVIALQELIDGHAAARIAAALNELAGTSAYTAVNSLPDSRQNRVAFVSRLPIVAAQTEPLTAWQSPPGGSVMRLDRVSGKIVTVPEPTLPRPPLRIRVSLSDGTTVDVINVHLKSRLVAFPGGGFSTHDESLRATATALVLKRRTAEAICVRARVDQLLAEGHRVIVLGDFNDGPDAATTTMFYRPRDNQPRDNEPREVGDATSGERAFHSFKSGDAQRLFNLTQLIAADVRWSSKRDDEREMLDQILASEGLMPRHGNRRQVPSIHVLNDDVPSILGRRHAAHSSGAFDHAIVYATFNAVN
jgi:endonuclease/exonuclease/phosphatase family metal-dependent hydrolase